MNTAEQLPARMTVYEEGMNKEDVMRIGEFMARMSIKSQTTFNKKSKTLPGFPESIEWPPGSRKRGWVRTAAEEYLQGAIENATPWEEIQKQTKEGEPAS